ncbi:MAG: hypothetical protein K1W10_17265 [Lachnospiraceae bacterium]
MSVNGVTSGAANAYDVYAATQTTGKPSEETNSTGNASDEKDNGVVYEPSKDTSKDTVTKTYTQNTNLVNKMKADAEAHAKQLQSIVEKLMSQQGDTFNKANGIWSVLASGNLKVDAATQAQAQKDIAEDGYWGVEQTSDRIIDFANALTGGDPDKIEEMREAFKKGYKQAEETWGGKLPDISQRTYDAVMEKFDKMAEEAGLTTTN